MWRMRCPNGSFNLNQWKVLNDQVREYYNGEKVRRARKAREQEKSAQTHTIGRSLTLPSAVSLSGVFRKVTLPVHHSDVFMLTHNAYLWYRI
jgi:cell envelope opacity-associated protein A